MILLYIDPGSGSVIVQLIVAGLASVVAFSKQIRTGVAGLFNNIFKKNRNED